MTIICLRALLVYAFALPSHEARAQDIEFGPGLRSIDFADIFDRRVPARASAWDRLHATGITTIVISQSLIAPVAPDNSERPRGTYLSDEELGWLRDTLNRGLSSEDDFHVTYVAGYGLGVTACLGTEEPEALGRSAAEWEYQAIVRRLLDQNIPIRAIDIDGPFLRLIGDSPKAFSCAQTVPGSGLSDNTAAQVAMVYMKHMRDLISSHPTNRHTGIEPQIGLLINLPNWQLGPSPSLAFSSITDDLNQILAAFGDAMKADTDRPLHLSGTVIDYPFNHVRSDVETFKAKSRDLLKALKRLPRTRARLTYITNTRYDLFPGETSSRRRSYKGVVNCVWIDNWEISGGSLPYLPYENAKGVRMPSDCVDEQNEADTRYFDESVLYAQNIASGAWRDPNVSLNEVAAYRFMSWHEMPVSTFTMMNRVLRYKLSGQ